MQQLPDPRPVRRPLVAFFVGMIITFIALEAFAQTPAERERQQMMQLQQQLQKLRQENAQLKQAGTQDVEKARAETERARRDAAAQVRASGTTSQREIKRLGDELALARETLAQREADVEKLRAELAQREAALLSTGQQWVEARRVAESERSVLAARLKVNAQRADHCEARHAQALRLSSELIERHEARQLRACEPFTGLWRVKEEEQVQALRDRLFEVRLDVAPADSAAAPGNGRAN
jgi:hypothetical protein